MICLPFKGDVLSTQIKQRLGAAIRRTYFAAELLVTHNCRSLLRESNVDKKSADVTSNCIYQFTCTCGSRYVGRTERILSTRISEHVPTNLTLNGPKLPSSAIGRHIIDSGHVIDKTKAFKVITRARNAQLLRFAEASAIRRIKPDLCVQKDFVAHLALPWWIIIQPYVLTFPQFFILIIFRTFDFSSILQCVCMYTWSYSQ